MNVHMMTQLNLGRKLFRFAEMTQIDRWNLLNQEKNERKQTNQNQNHHLVEYEQISINAQFYRKLPADSGTSVIRLAFVPIQ